MEKLIEAAKVVMADTFRFYLKAHYYHWNVEGPNFPQYHELFSDIYTEVWESLDGIAEQIRTMETYVPGSFGRFAELSQISDEREQVEAREMIKRLYNDNLLVLENIKLAFKAAEEAENYAFNDLMAEREAAHKKHGWMLRSTLK